MSIFFLFKKRFLASFYITVLFLCSIFLTLSYSKPLWDSVQPFWYIQFPWRYLLYIAVFSAFLGGFTLFLTERRFGKSVAVVVGVILSLLAIYQVRNYFQPQSYRAVTDNDMLSPIQLQWSVSKMSYEYVPKKEPTQLSPQKTTELVIASSGGKTVELSYGTPPDNMVVKEVKNTSFLKKYEVTVYATKKQSSAIFQVNTYVFPGWTVYVDGKKDTKLLNNYFHLIQLQLPLGKHTVVAEFKNTPIRTIANSISLLTVGLLCIIALFFKFKRK